MKRGFLLDTDTCIFALKQRPEVLGAMLSKPRASIHLSVVTEGELRFGAEKSASPTRTRRLLAAFLKPLRVLELSSEDIAVYATVRARLERAGTPIGPLDTFIAAQALARGLTLVTYNKRELSRVHGLPLDDWSS